MEKPATERLLELCRDTDDKTLAQVFRKCAKGLAERQEGDNAAILVTLILAEKRSQRN